MDLQIRHPGAVIHGQVQEVIAESLRALPTAGAVAAMDAVAATVRDPALLLDVQVDQLAGPLMLVAHDLAGRTIQLGQPWHLVASQHGRHGGMGLAQRPADPVRPNPIHRPIGQDGLLAGGRQPPRAGQRPGTSVDQPGQAFSPPATHPLVGRGHRDPWASAARAGGQP
jgi:hypothetical protein